MHGHCRILYVSFSFIGMILVSMASGYMLGKKANDSKYPKPVEQMGHWEKHYYDRLDEFRKENKSMKNIVLVGSSHIEGFRASALLPGRNIVNRGIASDRIGIDDRGVFRRLNESVFDCNPGLVFVENGINDIGEFYRNGEPSIAEMDTFYRKIIESIQMQRPDLPVVIVGLFPTSGRYKELSPYAEEFNKHLKQIAEDTKCPFLPVWEPYADKQGLLREDLTKDGLHLNEAGYKIWAGQIEDMIRTIQGHEDRPGKQKKK